jgi:archaellum component FlaC
MDTLTTALKALINETIDENESVTTLKSDVATLKSDVAMVKQDIAKLYEGQLYLGGMMEDMKHTLGLVLDAVIPARERATLVETVVAKVDDHEYRLSAVESTLKEPRA